MNDVSKTREFIEFWKGQRETLTRAQKDAIGKAYLSDIIGFTDETAKLFMSGHHAQERMVGHRLARLAEGRNDYRGFWDKVRRIKPAYSDADIEFLVGNEDHAIWSFLPRLSSLEESELVNPSFVILRLETTAVQYK